MTKSLYVIFAITSWLLSALNSAIAETNKPYFMPEWRMGDWWIVASDYISDLSGNPEIPSQVERFSGPMSYSVSRSFWKYSIAGTNMAGTDMCWVVEIRLHKLPQAHESKKDLVRDDTQGEPLWKLWIRESDRTLAKYSWRLREGLCLTQGDVKEEGERTCDQHAPVVPSAKIRCPLDVPMFTKVHSSLDWLGERGAKHTKYFDERKNAEQEQTVEILDDVALGKRQRVLIVTIPGPRINDLRVQKWISGYPWWVTWTQWGANGKLLAGLCRSRLVKYGSEGQEGKSVPTPEWW